MKKIIIAVCVMLGIVATGYFGWTMLMSNTKKYSPEASANYSKDGLALKVTYCQPSKKDRVIFGKLVPYNTVWRTGANEATQFSTNKTLVFADGSTLPAGTYSLFTIPTEGEWTVIFNKEVNQWGTQYSEDKDALRVKAASMALPATAEVLTIRFSDLDGQIQLLIEWDMTQAQLSMKAQ
jgi:Protein of unknown function (DUF2911)